MAVLTITEFERFTSGNSGSIPFMSDCIEQSLEIGPVSVRSEPLSDKSHFILLSASANCFIALGSPDDVEAKVGFHLVTAGDGPRIYSVKPGSAVAVIEEEDI